MLENGPSEPFSCVILYVIKLLCEKRNVMKLLKYVMKLLSEKRNVLPKTFLSPFKIIFLPDM